MTVKGDWRDGQTLQKENENQRELERGAYIAQSKL